MKFFFQYPLSPFEKKTILWAMSLQLLIAALPDPFTGGHFLTDIDDYRNWFRVLTLQGLETAYWGDMRPQVDYPPLIPYLHLVMGSVLHTFAPTLFFNNDVINFLIKIPPLVANGLIGYLLLMESKAQQLTLHRFAVALFFFAPPFIFDIAYWGQTDSITAVFLLASLLLLNREKLFTSYIIFTIACFVKPLAWPFSFLVLMVSLYKFTPQKILQATGLALLTAGIILLPFILEGNFIRILIRLFTQLDVQPFISINAHNFWWIVATPAGRWTNSLDLIFGLVSYKVVATGLFLIFNLVILLKAWSNLKNNQFDLFKTASMVAIAFFVFSPQMHENHLFNFFPLAFLYALRKDADPFYTRCYLVLIVCSFLNMLLHDHYCMRQINSFLWSMAGDPSRIAESVYNLFLIVLAIFNALVICVIFTQLLWQYLLGYPIPKTWNRAVGFSLGAVALVRLVI